MFYPAYIYTDCDGRANGFSPIYLGVFLLVEINLQQFDGRAERINITLPRHLLVKIDAFISGIRSSAPEAPFLPR